MAKTDNTSIKKKRRLKAAPTLREQTEAVPDKDKKSSLVGRLFALIFVPFYLIIRAIKKVARIISDSKFAKSINKIMKSKPFAPIRFIGKILGKVLFISYFKGSRDEIKQVVWPAARTTWHLTGAVLVFGIFFGLFIAGLDIVFEKAFREVLIGK